MVLRLDPPDGVERGDPVWVLPGQAPGTPFGELPNRAAGARVFVLEGADGVREEVLPRRYLDERWDADITLEYEVGPDGAARVRGRFQNAGPEGVMALGQVRQATAQQRDAFALSQAATLAPGSDVERAEVVLDDSRGPGIVVEFEGDAGERAGGRSRGVVHHPRELAQAVPLGGGGEFRFVGVGVDMAGEDVTDPGERA